MLAFRIPSLLHPCSSHIYLLFIRINAALKPVNFLSVFDKLLVNVHLQMDLPVLPHSLRSLAAPQFPAFLCVLCL